MNSMAKHALPKTPHGWKWWLKWLLVIGLVLIVFNGLFIHHRVSETTSKMAVKQSKTLPKQLNHKQPFTVLVMGTDVGALGRGTSYAGNTDTMELITVNPQTKKISLLAIPRDTLVRVETKKGPDYVKINAAYAIGGAKQAQKQVRELLDVPVDYYALVNMGTMKKVVDAVGGVDVDNPFAFTYEGHHFKKGRQHLNGNQALKYSRMRYDDPDNDYGRQKRGQQVIMSVVDTFKHHGSLNAANQIMTAVADGVRTDLPVNKVDALYFKYHAALANTERAALRGQDAKIGATDFQIASPHQMVKCSNYVRRALGKSTIKQVNNYETKMYHHQTNWDGYHHLTFRLPDGAQYNHPGSGTKAGW